MPRPRAEPGEGGTQIRCRSGRSLRTAYRGTAQVTGRTEAEILAWFDGLILAVPGLTEVWAWRPDCPLQLIRPPSARIRFLAGVARKPAPDRRRQS